MRKSLTASLLYFNSQPHKEADKAQAGGGRHDGYFNSQPHKEADRVNQCSVWVFSISTHSLTRRLTQQMAGQFQHMLNFNSQPHKEADNGQVFAYIVLDISTHSLTRRLTKDGTKPEGARLFQLTASQGG